MTVNPPWLDRQRLRARHAARTAARTAARAALIRLLERMPSQDLDAAVTAACVRRARRLSRPVRVPRAEWERDGLLATIRRHAGEQARNLSVVQDGIAQGRADLQFTHGTDALLAEMYADPQHPLRAAADARRRQPGTTPGPSDD